MFRKEERSQKDLLEMEALILLFIFMAEKFNKQAIGNGVCMLDYNVLNISVTWRHLVLLP